MLVIQIQMWPKGDKTKMYSMGTLTVALDPDTKSSKLRSYAWAISKFADRGPWKKGTIGGHDPNFRGPWDLLYRILRDAVGQRNP